MALKKHRSPPEKPMPEYQMYPVGMWRMFGAVLLMVVCLAIAVMLISDMAAPWLTERTLMHLELAVLVVLVLILSTTTFLLSRGWSVFHRFLIWHNRAYILILIAGSAYAFLAGDTGMAMVGAVGLGLALLAHRLYCSPQYSAGVEHYRLIWAHHRSNQRNS